MFRKRITRISICFLLLCTTPFYAQFYKKVLKEIAKGGKNIGKTIEKGVSDVKNASGDAIHDIGKATGKAAEDVRKGIEKGLNDASRAAGKAGKDIAAETQRVGKHGMDVGVAIEAYVKSRVESTGELINSTKERLEEGKIVDALYHLALDPLTAEEEAAFLATQKSGWLNTVGATAASAYGGPAGASAYAAWQTYRVSGGNTELALRAGLITGLTTAAMNGITTMDGATKVDMLKKGVLAGAVGGLAVAASGGTEEDIKTGFILGGGMVVIQDIYQNYTGHILDPTEATEEPYSWDSKTLQEAYYYDENGNLQLNTAKLSRKASHVGIGAEPPFNPPKPGAPVSLASDQSVLMRTAAKLPGFNAMGLFHDKWVVSWGMTSVQNKLTIFPALVFTYMGTSGPLNNKITDVVANTPQSGVDNPPSNSTTKPPAIPPPTTVSSVSMTVQENVTYKHSSGETYFGRGDKLYNRWGAEVKDQALLLSYQHYRKSLTDPALPSDPFMYDFSNPFSKLGGSKINSPSGFNGPDTSFKTLAPCELASVYTAYTENERFAFENMHVALHASAPAGSILYLRNLANCKITRLFVLGSVSAEDKKKGITLCLSRKAMQDLGGGTSVWVESEYEDVSVHSSTLERNNTGLTGKLVFNNLRDGAWRIRIYSEHNDTAIYSSNNYQNNWVANVLPGKYYFYLDNNSPGQTSREYQGSFMVK